MPPKSTERKRQELSFRGNRCWYYITVHIRTKWELIDIRGRSICNKDKYDRQVCISSLDLVYHSDCDPKEKIPGISYIIFFQVQYWPSDFGGFWTSRVSKLWSLYWPKVPVALIIFSHLQNLTALYSFLPATLETWLWFLATWRDWTAEFATLGTEPSPGSDSRTSASSLSGDTLTPRTSGLTPFSVFFPTLNRFEGIHAKHSPDWQLALKNTRLTDSGALNENSQFVTESAGPYECQVSTSPHMAHVVHLRVRGDLTQPRNTLRSCDASGGRAWDVCWVLQHDQPDLPGRLDCKTSW